MLPMPMQRRLTEVEKLEIIQGEWEKARAKNPKVILRVFVEDGTDESGRPQVKTVIASEGRVPDSQT
jgi:hypothetical protein